MPSRVTQSMLSSQLMRNLNSNMKQLDNLQNQLSTGRRINKPSDDPVGITYSMRYRSELSANDQFGRNIDQAQSWLDFTDTVLDQANQVFQRVRELAVQGASSTNPQTARDAIKSEIDELYSHMIQLGNSDFNGKHIFNGQITDRKPYSESNPESTVTDSYKVQFEISPGVKMSTSITGNEVFGAAGEQDNTFQVLKELSAALGSGDTGSVSDLIGQIDSRYDKFLQSRAEIGARTNRLDHAESRLNDISINLEKLQSKTEDADMAEVITNLKTSENVYQSSLSAGARLIRPSLIDFLR
jgi:flagellar hook-associated protein 3 FlgL